MSDKRRNPGTFWVLFVATGDKFPVRYYETSDTYIADLPTGIYEGEFIADLKRELRADFDGIRITK